MSTEELPNSLAVEREVDRQKRREQVLTHKKASVTEGTTEAMAIKDGDIFFLCGPSGDVPLTGQHGFGLYFHDCRYLGGYEVKINGRKPRPLLASASAGYRGNIQAASPKADSEGASLLAEEVGVHWDRALDGKNHLLNDRLRLENFSHKSFRLTIEFRFRAGFEDVFVVRGLVPKEMGRSYPPRAKGKSIRFRYTGADQTERGLNIRFSRRPTRRDGAFSFRVRLAPRGTWDLSVLVQVLEGKTASRSAVKANRFGALARSDRQAARAWSKRFTGIRTDSVLLGEITRRSIGDLRMLTTRIGREEFFAAGVPWFVTLFGRDTIITAIETLAFESRIAEESLRLLARYQGRKVDAWTDEEPGKILHEVRVGELARTNQIPQQPYYGTVDATLLFLVLLGRTCRWTGDLALFKEMSAHVERALAWADQYGDKNRDGFIEYESHTRAGLVNQGWKDSGDAIVKADGRLAAPPISLTEVQGYLYEAKRRMAWLFRLAGNAPRAAALEREASNLRRRFNKTFWSASLKCFAMALEKNGRRVDVISSNAGHALWSGIADPQKARWVMKRLMADDMYSGWGVRTLSSSERGYNPLGYHLGTVWPHDNAIIAAGFRQYGFDDAAERIANGIIDAGMNFRHYRLPEVFCGFSRSEYGVPVPYPVACQPQAWSAGSVPFLIATALGLEPDAFANRLRVVRPFLPRSADWVELHDLQIGKHSVDLRFERVRGGHVRGRALKKSRGLDVEFR